MKDAYSNAGILKRDSLVVTLTVYFFCLVQTFEYLKIDTAFVDKFTVLFLAAAVLFFLVLIYRIPWIGAYSLLTSLVLFLFYVVIVLITNGANYFFIVCVCIIWVGYLCNEAGATLLYVIISNIIINMLISSGKPLMDESLTVINICWGVSLAVSCFLVYMTYSVSSNKSNTEKERYYAKTILERTPTCIALIDEMRRVLYIGKTMAETFHIACPHLMKGLPITDAIDNVELRTMLLIVMHDNKAYEATWEVTVHNRKRFYQILYQKSYNVLGGTFLRLNDVTGIMAAKLEAEQNARAKSIFLANTSHEIRTPMNAILGMVELILRKNISPDVYENAITIKQSGENLLAIINDILDFSKIESGKFEIVPANYLFASLIQDIINIIRVKLSDKPILFIVTVANTLPKELFGDMSRVRQVLLNLLSNAVKFTTEGYISLRVSGELVQNTSSRIMLCFQVSDTGIGMKKEDMSKLFDNFTQLTSRPNNIEGTGLGLAISRSLCTLMEGDITVSSEFGKGSVFTASIVQDIIDSTDFASVDDPRHKTALVYDNRAVYAESISQTIYALGAPCDVALNEEEFILALQTKRYAFVFISSVLYQTARTILLQFARQATTVVLTELNEAVATPPDCITIATPAYALSIANVLNGNNKQVESAENTVLNIRFSAPSARVLIVDDIPTNLKVAMGLMLPYKMKIDTAISGIEALKLLHENEYDIIFMDHMMPIMDGIETLHKIREQGGIYRNLPVIVLTANAVVGMKEMFIEQGFSDYLSKPIDTSKLDSILFKWIPKDKHQKPHAMIVRKKLSATMVSTIEDIDVTEGIRMANGSIESYYDILMVYIKDSKERYGTLCSFLQTIEITEPEPPVLSLFTTQVHALKSASASIGAKKLSEEAFKLEMAGRAAAIDFIRQNLGLFCSSLAVTIERIERILPKQDTAGNEDSKRAIRDEDRRTMLDLKEALKQEDIRSIDVLFAALNGRNFTSAVKEKLGTIGDLILVSDFKEARAVLEELLV
ncbi:MAG: response regulator [Treponema sp.]|jgi:signal transduction histidine kinase/CheY-like chemotaxis protein|nr:response regulator [Treponema sp.]